MVANNFVRIHLCSKMASSKRAHQSHHFGSNQRCQTWGRLGQLGFINSHKFSIKFIYYLILDLG